MFDAAERIRMGFHIEQLLPLIEWSEEIQRQIQEALKPL
jgi:hypothetical protein